jgi:cobalt/nickel transport system permease protein
LLLIDKYAYTNKLAKTNPLIKFIIVVISLMITTIISNNYINMSIFAIMVFLTTVIAKIPFDKYIKILIIPISFLIISLITILISISGEDIYIWSIRIGSSYIGITKDSLIQSINLTTRVFASLSATFFLALTTSLNNLIKVFKKMKVPNTIIELLVLIYRSIFIFLEESKEIYQAQEIRFGYLGFKNGFKSTALLMKSLFIRVLLRYEEMVVALDCKLYNGEFKIGD